MRVVPCLALLPALLALPATARAQLPADGWFVWMSNRLDGRHEIYRRSVAGTEQPQRLTFNGGQLPLISPDGRWIAYRFPGDGSVHIVSPDGKVDRKLCQGLPVEANPGFWLPYGSGFVCALYTVSPKIDVEYRLVDPDSGAWKTLFWQTEFKHFKTKRFDPGGMTRDGRWLVGWGHDLFLNGYQATNGIFKFPTASVALDLQDKDAVYYIGPGCFATAAPQGPWLYHASRNNEATLPDIYRLSVDQIQDRSSYAPEVAFPDPDWGHENMPRISTDNRWLIYATTTGCHNWVDCDYDVFVHLLGSAPTERIRLTEDPSNDSFPHMYVPLPANGVDAAAAKPDASAPADVGLDAQVVEQVNDPSCGCTLAARPRRSPAGWIVLVLLLLLIGHGRSAARPPRRPDGPAG